MANTAKFLGVDTATSGSWIGVYGSDGYQVYNGTTALPSYVSVTLQTASNYAPFVQSDTTTDTQWLFKSSGGPPRTAAWWAWNGSNTLAMTFTVNDGNTHNLAIYCNELAQANSFSLLFVDNATGLNLTGSGSPSSIPGTYFLYQISGTVKLYVYPVGGGGYALISGIFFGSFASPTVGPYPSSDVTNSGNWSLVSRASDEFNGSSFDTSKWNSPPVFWPGVWYGNLAVGHPSSCYLPTNISVSSGLLQAACRYDPTNSTIPAAQVAQGYNSYTGVGFGAKIALLYCYYEARCKMPACSFDCGPWMDQNNPIVGSPAEIDVCEITAKTGPNGTLAINTVGQNIHGESGGSNGSTFALGTDCSAGFNTYGILWTPTSVTWYVNGITTATIASPTVHTAQVPMMAFGTNYGYTGDPTSTDFPTNGYVDYIRVWQQPPYIQNFAGNFRRRRR